MDSSILNALDDLIDLPNRAHQTGKYSLAGEYAGTVAQRIKNAILTAEPAPCEDAREIARAMLIKYKTRADYDVFEASKEIDAYAARREQKAREDERRRDIAAAKSLKIPVIPGRQEPNKDKYNDVIDDAIRAILQGTEPASVEPVSGEEPDGQC